VLGIHDGAERCYIETEQRKGGKMKNPVYGYKVTGPDSKCRGFEYKVGVRYKYDKDGKDIWANEIKLCNSGFHFCEKLIDCFSYYQFSPKNKVFRIIARGKIITGENKSVTDDIEIIEELSWQEVLKMVNIGTGNTGYNNSGNGNSGNENTGSYNSGDQNTGDENTSDGNSGNGNSGEENLGNRNPGNRNSGDWNSGDYNSGSWNSGNCNSGNCNSGNWNTCDSSSGFFNTKEQTLIIFNKDSGLTKKEFFCQYKIPACLYFKLNEWIEISEMTDEEKNTHPEYKALGGYLRTYNYKEAAQKSISRATEDEKEQIRALPNYDPDIFEEIFGIRLELRREIKEKK
jgi:hypothetical protein